MLSIDECREDGRLWVKFKEAFRTWISINHSDFLQITDLEGKYPEAIKPSEPAKSASDLAQKIYLEEYKTSAKKTEKYEEAKPQIYGALYGSLAECSRVKIREDADWQRCEDHHHPLQLYKLVEKVHLRPRSTGIAENDQDEAVDYYNNLRQAPSEPLHAYHQKVTAALDTLRAIGAPKEQGRRVVKSLAHQRVEPVERPLLRNQESYWDIMYLDDDPFLVALFKPCRVTKIEHLQKRTAAELLEKFTQIVRAITPAGFTVKTAHFDREGRLIKALSQIAALGIQPEPSGTGQHIPDIENLIREVKKILRCVNV